MNQNQPLKPLKFADVTPATISSRQPKKASFSWAKLLFIGGPLAVIVLITGGILLQLQQNDPGNLNDVHIVAQRVGRHYTLPTNETPALATVTDKKALQTPFLQQANNGDKILIYQKAKRVIIYRPGIDKIVDVGPVSVAPSQAGSEQTGQY